MREERPLRDIALALIGSSIVAAIVVPILAAAPELWRYEHRCLRSHVERQERLSIVLIGGRIPLIRRRERQVRVCDEQVTVARW